MKKKIELKKFWQYIRIIIFEKNSKKKKIIIKNWTKIRMNFEKHTHLIFQKKKSNSKLDK